MRTFDIPEKYKSPIIGKVKAYRKAKDPRKRDFSPTVLKFGSVEFILARHFGFCFGVENAIERAYKALAENPEKNIYLISQMIHNPAVNDDLEALGIKFIMDTEGNMLRKWDEVKKDDIVLIPAFGTTREIEELLNKKGIDIQTYNTTCPFVEKVWNRSAKLGKEDHTVIIHGKPNHEETRATFSHASEYAQAVIIRNMEEAEILADFILRKKPLNEFENFFAGRTSKGFNPEDHLQKVGVVNQTTMLASETQSIAEYLKKTMALKYGTENIRPHFADTRDTLCYATNDNQTATYELLKEQADIAIVVGGYNSSNTSHIVELCERKFPTYFIKNEDEIKSSSLIHHWNYPKKRMQQTQKWLPEKDIIRIVLTSGASCPDALLDQVMGKILGMCNAVSNIDIALAAFQKKY